MCEKGEKSERNLISLYTNKSDGSYDYVPVDGGLMYFRYDDFLFYISKINSNKL